MSAKQVLKKALAGLGFEVRRVGLPPGGYISARKTIEDARDANLSIGDYVERMWKVEGGSQAVVDQMAAAGVFDRRPATVLEIGAGTGRYMDKVIRAYGRGNLTEYHSYEVAADWAAYLGRTYPIVSHQADGLSLTQTASKSVDVVHAHGVFVYTPFLTTIRYFREVSRVLRAGGHVVFDVYSEDCFSEESLNRWLAAGDTYPKIFPEDYLTDMYLAAGFKKVATLKRPHGASVSKYFIFQLTDGSR